MTIRLDGPDENPVKVMDTLIPPPEAAADITTIKTPEAETEVSATDMAKSDDSIDMHYEMLSEQELRMQREEEKYALYISILNKEEESNIETDTDNTTYTYFN